MKLEKLRLAMQEKGIDALLVTDEINQRYLLNYAFTDGYLVILQESAYMVTDFRYREEAEKYADPAFRVVTPTPRAPYVQALLKNARVRTVGYEDRRLTVAEYHRFEELLSGYSLTPVGGLLEELRQYKTEEEVRLMQAAQDITDQAFSHLLSVLRPDMTEIEVALELEFEMRRLGADGYAFDTIAVSGDASSLPHGKPRNEKLHRGFLTMDFGAKYKGYCSDMTRTVVIGRADSEMKRLYDTVLEAQKQGIAAVRAGAVCREVDGVARTLIDGAGYEGCFGHSLGHGVGLFIHESPRLAQGAGNACLVSGQVVTVEPGIYLAGKYGCRIEDMVLVQEEACYNFTHSPKDLIEIL